MPYNDNRRNNRTNNERRNSDSNREIKEIILKIKAVKQLSELTVKEYADEGGYADIIAKNLKDLNTTQLRKFFGAVRLIEQKKEWEEIEVGFYLLKPQLAAAKGRNLVPKEFYDVLMAAMRKVDVGSKEDKLENFNTFTKFFESIVAYHKFYNGK